MDNKFAGQLTLRLEMALKGIKNHRAVATHHTRLPITVENMEKLRTRIQVRIMQSKADPIRQGCTLHLGKTEKDICPISAILPYLAIRGARQGPLFIMANGTFLTRGLFAGALTDTLQEAGIDSKGYNTQFPDRRRNNCQ